MIYILDNGGNYSDHSISFIDSEDFPEELVEKSLPMLLGGFIAGQAPVIDWWQGEALSFSESFHFCRLITWTGCGKEEISNIKVKENIISLFDKESIEKLIARWDAQRNFGNWEIDWKNVKQVILEYFSNKEK